MGQRIETLTLDIFELLFSIPTCEDKIKILSQISVKLDLLKMLLRLAKDGQALENNKYLKLESILQEIGRMLGGWIRSAKHSA